MGRGMSLSARLSVHLLYPPVCLPICLLWPEGALRRTRHISGSPCCPSVCSGTFCRRGCTRRGGIGQGGKSSWTYGVASRACGMLVTSMLMGMVRVAVVRVVLLLGQICPSLRVEVMSGSSGAAVGGGKGVELYQGLRRGRWPHPLPWRHTGCWGLGARLLDLSRTSTVERLRAMTQVRHRRAQGVVGFPTCHEDTPGVGGSGGRDVPLGGGVCLLDRSGTLSMESGGGRGLTQACNSLDPHLA